MQSRRPPGPPSVGDLARTHAPRAARIAVMGVAAVALLAATGGLIRLAQHRIDQAPSRPVTPPDIEHPTRAWTGTSRFGAISGVLAAGDTLYASTGDGLLAYPLPCEAQNRICRPVWHDLVPDGPLSAPVSGGDVVYAGSARGRVYAFPADCQDTICDPLWSGEAGSGSVSAPGVNDDFVYVASESVYAFPARCGGADLVCPPSWVGEIPGRASAGAPAVGGGLVVVAWHAGEAGGVTAFPAVCLDACAPVWTADTGGPTTSVTLSAGTAYVVAGGALLAFPLSCRGECEPSWTGPFLMGLPYGMGALERPTLDGDRVYVGGTDGRLWVFPNACPSSICASLDSVSFGKQTLLGPIVRNEVAYVATLAGKLASVDDACLGPVKATSGCGDNWTDTLGSAVGAGPVSADDVLYVGDDAGTVHAFAIPRG